MIVVSDTSPINYLVLIGRADLLARLYGRVIVPLAVDAELQRDSTPLVVRQWIARPPAWLSIGPAPANQDPGLSRLGKGEREAISLAQELRVDAILIDERDGRRAAEQRHLVVVGTLQVLDTAAEEGLLDLPSTLSELRNTTF
jgi:predicted nucleic acid-binding protein